MRMITKLFLLMVVVITIVPIVSADMTCSFINITTGPPGAANMTAGPTGATGPMNLTPNMTAGPAGAPGPDNDAWYLWINGTRAMTGNLSMGSQYINNLFSGDLENDAVNKSYVDGAVAGMSNYNATYDAKPDSNYNATYDAYTNYNATYDGQSNYNASYITSTYNATYDAKTNYNASYITSTYNATYDGQSNYNASYITSTFNTTYDAYTNYNATYDAKPDSTFNATYDTYTNYNASYITSTYNATYDGQSNYNASYITSTYNATYDAKPDSTFNATYDALTGISNYNASYVEHSNTSYFLTDGSRTMLGNITFTGNWYINDLINPSQEQDAATKNYVDTEIAGIDLTSYNATYDAYTNYNATYDAKTNYNASYITSTYNATYDAKTNYNASYITSTYNATYDVKLQNPVFGYMTLMAGSGMIPSTNPSYMNQFETTTHKNNYISMNFSNGGSENAQWIMDFPADWDYSGNVVFTPIWTAASGSGTVYWQIKGKLFPDDAALDTALANISSSTDTLIATDDLHVAPNTTGAAITSVGTGGTTAIIRVERDSTQDSLSGTAELIGLRIKYIRNFA